MWLMLKNHKLPERVSAKQVLKARRGGLGEPGVWDQLAPVL